MTESHRGDAEVFDRAVAGDASALEDLLVRYLPRLRAFVRTRMGDELRRREASLDLVQSVCRELVERRERFEFRGEAQFRGWLFTSALNKIRQKHEYHRALKRDVQHEVALDGAARHSDDALLEAYGAIRTPSQDVSSAEQVARIEAAFDRLPEDYRRVIALARFAGLPHDEIATQLDRSVGAVRQMLGRALARLGVELER